MTLLPDHGPSGPHAATPPADPAGPASSAQEVSDAELDTAILARLRMLGVDLSVLPEDDPESPADQRRILSSARSFLRSTPSAISGFAMDPQEVAPVMYPATLEAHLVSDGVGQLEPGEEGS